ncbi:DUF6477 family protein [Tropicimonas sp. IMCC34011]|uniref:DUF6477 family protein n=1 Tax=Tropicimonas sp. IMCC34011 TaxID=2248759 RepID=UPI000E21FBA1|nr:DUF6477 family protein [Tropicimonas sp. IMCC34011]
MTTLPDAIATLRRPTLLVRAARIGAEDYDRRRDLPRLFGEEDVPGSEAALGRLLAEEAVLEEVRCRRDAAYSPLRHVDVMIALTAEARLMGRTPPHSTASPQERAGAI